MEPAPQALRGDGEEDGSEPERQDRQTHGDDSAVAREDDVAGRELAPHAQHDDDRR